MINIIDHLQVVYVSGHAKLSLNLHLVRCGNWRTFRVACMVCFPTIMGFKASVHVGIHFG